MKEIFMLFVLGLAFCFSQEPTESLMTFTMSSNYTFLPATAEPSGNQTYPLNHANKTLSPDLLGNVKHCPQYVRQGAHSNGYVLTQHHQSCYEVCQDRVSWTHAHMLCTERGGHLVSIHSHAENSYLRQILGHVYNHTVWIGLYDKVHEEHFQWTTGEKVNFTHWRQHHRMSANHTHEDCVVMHTNGFWDDVQCGANYQPHEANRTVHGYVCEYKTHNYGSFIVG